MSRRIAFLPCGVDMSLFRKKPVASSSAKTKTTPPKAFQKNPLAIALEPRFLLDAAAVATATEVAADQAAQDAAVQAEQVQTTAVDSAQDAAQALAELAVAPTAAASRNEIAFIDTRVKDWEVLRDSVRDGVEVFLIDASRDGLQQMA